MTISKRALGFLGIVAAIFITAFVMSYSATVFAGITYNQPAQKDTFVTHDFFPVATTTTATSTNALTPDRTVRIDGAKKVNLVYSRTGNFGNAGSSTFYPQVSHDGSTWFYFGKQVESASTTLPATAITLTAPGVTITGTTTITRGLMLEDDGYRFLRCVVVEATDGEHSCKANVTY